MIKRAWMVLLLLTTIAAGDQAGAQTIGGPTLYRLDQTSSYVQGCFAPCLCPIMLDRPVKGTFLLTPTGFNGLFETYSVTEVNWLVSINGTNQIVTGSGTYKIGGEVALQQELSLDLRIGQGQVEHFDSGLAAVTAPFPEIKVTISLHGQVCFDTVFSVSASPAPLDQILPYRLLANSTFERGCFGACECPLGPLEPILGTFAVVPLEATLPSRQFAVINVNWLVPEVSGTIPVNGLGFYEISGKSALEQELSLVLNIGNEAPAFFDSGLVADGSNFPLLDVGISVSGAICFNTWIDLHAGPASVSPATKAEPAALMSRE